jgi:soluble lytic murein transglycosylase
MDEMKRTIENWFDVPQKLLAGTIAASSLLFLAPAGVLAQSNPPHGVRAHACRASAPAWARSDARRQCRRAGPGAARCPREQDEMFLQLREAARQNDAAKAPNWRRACPTTRFLPMSTIIGSNRACATPRARKSGFPEALGGQRHRRPPAQRLAARTRAPARLGQLRPRTAAVRQNDDYQVRCYALLSRAVEGRERGRRSARPARQSAAVRRSLRRPGGQLAQSGQFTKDDLLAQLRLAGEMHATGPSRRTAAAARRLRHPRRPGGRLAGAGDGARHRQHPRRARNLPGRGRPHGAHQPEAGDRGAGQECAKLSADERAIGWANIALAASLTLAPEAWTTGSAPQARRCRNSR